MAQTLTGKVSWFGGPGDPSSGSQTASGAPVTEPGIAVYNHATLGGYWNVTFPNGRSLVLKQTDIGPAPWTGRLVDVTYSALGKAGYTTGNFPTDSTVTATYLGKNAPSGAVTSSTGSSSSSGGGPLDLVGMFSGPLLNALLYLALVGAGAFLAGYGIYQLANAGSGGRARELAGAGAKAAAVAA